MGKSRICPSCRGHYTGGTHRCPSGYPQPYQQPSPQASSKGGK